MKPFQSALVAICRFFCAKALSFVKDSPFAPYSPAIPATWALLLMISGVQVLHLELHLVWSLLSPLSPQSPCLWVLRQNSSSRLGVWQSR